ncbi:MAG: hypothetical protein ACHQ2Z_12710, partial [Elusimicrobiota bacterium]
MTYSYPAPRTGTAQDLLRVVTRAYELELERKGVLLPVKSEASRRWIEPGFRALGIVLAKVLEAIPADWTVAFHDRLFSSLAAPRSYAFDAESPQMLRARSLAADVEKRTGRAPALLAL